MKQLGTTLGGTLVVELTVSEVKAWREFFGAIQTAEAPVADAPVIIVHSEASAKESPIRRKSSLRPRAALHAPAQEKPKRLCVICGKPVGPRKKTCSTACRLAHNLWRPR